MSKFIGSFWLVICVMYIFDMLEPTGFGMIMTSLMLAIYSFNEKK